MRKELIVGVAKRLAFAGACTTLLFMFGSASSASADNGIHVAGAGAVADGCAGCHRTHTAQAAKILKSAMPGLCTTCHGSTGTGATTDVMNGIGYASALPRAGAATGALRGGGFTTARIDSANPTGQGGPYTPGASAAIPALTAGVATTSAHSVDGTGATAWGNGAISAVATYGKSINLTCGSCHDPHGNGNYRILKAVPTDSGGTAVNITEALATPKTYTTANYWQVKDINTAGYIANVSNWCSTCHTRYLSSSGGASNTSGDAVFTYRHTSDNAAQGSANCIQCHVSHGSNAAMTGPASAAASLLVPAGPTASSSKLLRIDNRGTCQMCHNK